MALVCTDKDRDKVILVPDNHHGIVYAVTIPKETRDEEIKEISKWVIGAANEYYKTPIAIRQKHNIDLLKWIAKYLEIKKFKIIKVSELG